MTNAGFSHHLAGLKTKFVQLSRGPSCLYWVRHRAGLTRPTPRQFPCLACAPAKFGDEPSMSSRRPGWAPILVMVASASASVVAVPSVREPVLRAKDGTLSSKSLVAPSLWFCSLPYLSLTVVLGAAARSPRDIQLG